MSRGLTQGAAMNTASVTDFSGRKTNTKGFMGVRIKQ
jgi:hypothetical protein